MKNTPQMLLVDDNRRYKEKLEHIYQSQGFRIDWVKSAGEARNRIREHGLDYYDTIVTDITMETQTSGLLFAISLRRQGYRGRIIIASTGFDFGIVLYPALFLLGIFGIDGLIPKKSLRFDSPRIIDCYRFTFNSQS